MKLFRTRQLRITREKQNGLHVWHQISNDAYIFLTLHNHRVASSILCLFLSLSLCFTFTFTHNYSGDTNPTASLKLMASKQVDPLNLCYIIVHVHTYNSQQLMKDKLPSDVSITFRLLF